MNILVTGSTGFFGKIIVRELDKNLYTLNRTQGDFRCDLSLSSPEFNIDFDLVIHNAGKAHTAPQSDADKRAFFSVNIEGTINLLKGLEVEKPKQFVLISSVAVYGRDSGLNIIENSTLSAKDPYGLSKIRAEQVVSDWCEKNNVVYTILRLPLLVGNNPPGNLGAMINAIQKGYYFNIAGGYAKKSMVLADNVARFIPVIARIGGIYNLTDGYHPTYAELSAAISNKKKIYNLHFVLARIAGVLGDHMGSRAPFNSTMLKKMTSDLTFDDSKAREMGWNPQPVLEFFR